jgi:hypothetical protein
MYWPIYILILITAIFNGWGNALIFITSSKYVNECANESNMGLYNSILLIFNQSSMISGSLLASFLIPDTSKITFLIISVA